MEMALKAYKLGGINKRLEAAVRAVFKAMRDAIQELSALH
jgi:hypothetical protein